MHAARGIVTARGGMTSHAAVVARGMGRPCVSGAGELSIDAKGRTFTARGRTVRAGDVITIDGSRARCCWARQHDRAGALRRLLALMEWADRVRRLRVRANAETPLDARTARQFGAEGIGLCRTEHMFFDEDRIAAVREMILADDEPGRPRRRWPRSRPSSGRTSWSCSRSWRGCRSPSACSTRRCTSSCPTRRMTCGRWRRPPAFDAAKLMRRARELHETNPMLGWRGCRLGVAFPEIYEMQVRAVFEAACELAKGGHPPIPEYMHPLSPRIGDDCSLRDFTRPPPGW
jgi:pyruvate,orthophosphate dikinase